MQKPYFMCLWPIMYLLLRSPETYCASCSSICSAITRIKSKRLSLLMLGINCQISWHDDSVKRCCKISHKIMQIVCCQRCAIKFLLHRCALQYRLNIPLTVIYLFHILRSFFTTVNISAIYGQNSKYWSFVSMNFALFQTVFSGSDNCPYTKQSKYNTGSGLCCRVPHYSTVHSACSGLYVYLLPHYKAASLTCGSSCSFVCVSSTRLLALCTNSMLSFLLCVLREVESAVVTRLL